MISLSLLAEFHVWTNVIDPSFPLILLLSLAYFENWPHPIQSDHTPCYNYPIIPASWRPLLFEPISCLSSYDKHKLDSCFSINMMSITFLLPWDHLSSLCNRTLFSWLSSLLMFTSSNHGNPDLIFHTLLIVSRWLVWAFLNCPFLNNLFILNWDFS